MAVKFTRQAKKAAKKILNADARIAENLHKRICELEQNPFPPSAKLMKNAPEGVYRIAFSGDYGRIVYYVDGDDLHILAVGPQAKHAIAGFIHPATQEGVWTGMRLCLPARLWRSCFLP